MSVDISVSITEDIVDIIATPTVNIVNVTNSASIDPSLYDLSEFTNTSPNPFVRTSGLSSYVPTSRTISTTSPLSGGGDLSVNRTLSISQANGTTNGFLSSSDWTMFNNKQNALGYTPVPETRTLTINGTTQDLSADRTFTISTGITIGTTLITSGTVGRVLFEGTGNVVQESANLTWDNTNSRLALNGTLGKLMFPSPEISFGSRFNGIHFTDSTYATSYGYLSLSSGFGEFRMFAASSYFPTFYSNGAERMRIFTTGNIGINTTTDAGFRLDVNGTARVVGQATIQTLTVGLGGGAVATNTALGLIALLANTTGTANTALGHTSLSNNTTGAGNTAIGFNSLNGTNGTNNSGLGNSTLRHITSGSLNTAVGAEAGRYIADGVTNLTTCDNSVFLGMSARPLANSQTNQIAIGHNAIGAGSNTATLGNTSILDTILRGRINLQQYATGSRPTYVKGALIYDSTLSKLVVGGATGWEVVTSI